jgi:parallel beta-helix repeat protein
MRMKKIISLCLVAALTVFGVPQYAAKAEAATTNYSKAVAQYGAENVVNVTEKGIDASGNSDCGVSITTLSRVLARSPREVTTPIVLYFPSGNYKLADSMKIYAQNVHVVAEEDSVFTASKSLKGLLEIRDTSDVTVLGGKWNGNNKAKYGILFSNAKSASATDCNVSKLNERGVHLISSTASLTNVSSYNNKKYGVSTTKGADLTMTNCSVYGNKEHGIVIADSILHMENGNNKIYKNGLSGISGSGKKTKMFISGNSITKNGTANDAKGHGIGVAESAYAEITNNTLDANKQCGISLISKANVVAKGNSLKNNGRHGIGAAESSILTAEGNTATGNKWHGMMLRDKCKATLTNNTLNSNKVAGLSIEKTSGTITVTGNTMYKNKSNGIIVTKGKIKLTNNSITKNKAFGIYTDGATVTVVSGNTIKSNSMGDINTSGSKVKIGKENTVKKLVSE